MGVAHEEDERWTEVWNKRNLEGWLEEGLTREQIAEKVAGLSGRRPMSKAAVSMAMARWGIPARRVRYDQTIPWRVAGVHARVKEVELLRFLGRRMAGLPLGRAESDAWLRSWIEELRAAGSPVIVYYADSPDGFYPIRRDKIDELDVPYVDPVALYDGLGIEG